MKRVVIIGANGQLGSELEVAFKNNTENEVIGLTHSDINIENFDKARDILTNLKPSIVLNTAAYHVVPKCEENPEVAFRINSLGALNIAKISNELKAINIYYSTDYVFDGKKQTPYVETDIPNPLNVYATSKLSGEFFTNNYSYKGIVIRISGIYGKTPCRAKGGNFITNMIKFAKERSEVKVVTDEILTPTSTEAISINTQCLASTEDFGIYHMTAEGECSWFDFAREIFDVLKLKTPLLRIKTSDNPFTIRRPTYSVLENHALNQIKLNKMCHWKFSLHKYLKDNYL